MSLAVHYEELTGADGPRIRYRPERYQARALYGQFPPEVEIGGARHKILDLSMSGLAVAVRRDQTNFGELGSELDLRIIDQDAELFRGRARVCRVEPTPFHTKVALHLVRGFLDLPKTVVEHSKLLARQTFARGPGVDPRYREHCADVVHMLRRYRAAFEEVGRNPVSDYVDRGKLEAELLPFCEERLIPEWRDALRAGNALAAEISLDPDALRAAKTYTELVLTPEFMTSAIWRRGYEKPFGYPGDFEIMDGLYSQRTVGDTPFAKLLHRIATDMGTCILARTVQMEKAILETVAAKSNDEPVRITSIGSGAAREVENYLRIKSSPRRVEFTLVDQDERALSFAYANTYPIVARLNGDAEVNCLQVSFSELLRAGSYFGKLPPQDLIYSAGLVDYLSPKRARALVVDLYDQLAPGGLLVVGNMGDSPLGTLWPLEFISDWSLIYRGPDQMLAMVRDFDPAMTELRSTDSDNRAYLLRLRKPF